MSLTNSITSVTSVIRGLIGDRLKSDGRNAFTYKTSSVFTLSKDYISSATIKVFVNGTETSGFTYSSDNNQVTISDSLTLNDIVLITYSYYGEYSDNEIQGFLESSFSYFVQYQYKKTFEVVGTEIVAINAVNPTVNELYFIAIIASILINPQNVKISIPDLSIDAKRDISDQEQIMIAFRNFKNFMGTFSFNDKGDVSYEL